MVTEETAVAERPAPKLHGRSQVRLFCDGGFFTSSDAVWKTQRFSATLLMAATEQDFELEVGGQTRRLGMVAIRPFVTTQLNARHVPFVCLDLSPDHAEYHAFAGIGGNGTLALPRARFAGLADALRAFHAGGMRGDDSFRLFWRITNLALTLVPAAAPPDPRVLHAKAALAQNHELTAEQLASLCGLTPRRLSTLFADELGISLRRYIQWLKIKVALSLVGSGLSLTEIAAAAGFADSAHFSKVWTQIYGASPVYFFCNDDVDVFPKPQSPRFRSLNAANSHERMPTTKV